MAVADYNVSPALNVTINGINIGEGMSRSDVNQALRQVMADVKAFSLTVPTAPISRANGGTATAAVDAATAAVAFTTLADWGGSIGAPIKKVGAGVYPHYASTSMTDARIFVQALGTDPTANPGDIVVEY